MPSDGNYYFGHRDGRATDAWRKSIDRPTGLELTTGNIGKLADHAASVDSIIAKIDSDLADLSARLDRIEAQRRDEVAFLAKRRS
jgi:hypothetical protein